MSAGIAAPDGDERERLPSREKSRPPTISAGSSGAQDRLAGLQVEQLELALAGDVPEQRGRRAGVVEREARELRVRALGEQS